MFLGYNLTARRENGPPAALIYCCSEHEEHASRDKHTINFSNQLREVLGAHVFKDAGACDEVKAAVGKW